MKASVNTRYGTPEVLSVRQIEEPQPGPDEVKIAVHYSSVNRTDSGFLTGWPLIARLFSGLLKPRFHVLGNEFSGEVVEIGENVTLFSVGDRVFGIDADQFGAHAEFIVVSEGSAVAKLPGHIDFRTAAAACEGSHYALVDIRAARVKEGHDVLINGATGAIGSAAVQLCKFLGAHVTAVCSGEHTEKVRALGADEVIDYQTSDFTKIGRTFHFIFDAVGKSTFFKCRTLLKPQGIYVSTELGPYYMNPFLALLTPCFGGRKLLFPIPKVHAEDIRLFADLLSTGRFNPLIDREYPLEQTKEAFEYVLTGEKIGNVLLKIRG